MMLKRKAFICCIPEANLYLRESVLARRISIIRVKAFKASLDDIV